MVFGWLKRRTNRYVDDDSEEYGLQGGSSTSGASLKAALIFIVPMWAVSITWSILPPFLAYYGWPEIFIWTFAGVSILMSITLPILGYFLMMNAKIAYLAGKDKLHAILGWSGEDWDKVDLATSGDPIPIATTDDLSSEGFLKNVEAAVDAIRAEQIGGRNNYDSTRTTGNRKQ